VTESKILREVGVAYAGSICPAIDAAVALPVVLSALAVPTIQRKIDLIAMDEQNTLHASTNSSTARDRSFRSAPSDDSE